MTTANTGYIEGPSATAGRPRSSSTSTNILIVLMLFAAGGAAVVEFLEGSYLRSFQVASFGLPFGVYAVFLVAGGDLQKELAAHRWKSAVYLSPFYVSLVAAVVIMKREDNLGRLGMTAWASGVAIVIYLYMKRKNDRRRTAAAPAPSQAR